MADNLYIETQNIINALDKLPGKIQLKIVDSALRVSAKRVAEAVKEEVPHDTERLANNVMIKKARTPDKRYTTFRIGFKKGKAIYASMIHFGSKNHTPNPFFFRAMEKTKGEVNGIMRDALRKKIGAQIKKLNKGRK